MAFLGDIFGRMGRVVRGQANAGVDVIEDATFEATVRQTVADMKTELNKVVRASAMAMSNYNSLEAEYRRQRSDLLGALQWWLRDVWLQTVSHSSSSSNILGFPDLATAAHSSDACWAEPGCGGAEPGIPG